MAFKFYIRKILFYLMLVAVMFSCKKNSDLEDEIAKINSDAHIERFDLLFSKINSENSCILAFFLLKSLKISYLLPSSKMYLIFPENSSPLHGLYLSKSDICLPFLFCQHLIL